MGCCERGNEYKLKNNKKNKIVAKYINGNVSFGSIKYRGFLGSLGNSYFLKKESAPWSWLVCQLLLGDCSPYL